MSLQPVDDEVAAGPELRDHVVDLALRAAQRLDRARLGEGGRATHRVDDERAVGLLEPFRDDRVAEPPASHGIRLREAVEDDRPVGHPGQARERDVLGAVVQDSGIDLVGQHEEVMTDGELGDPLDVRGGQDAARRVGRRVDDEELRLRCDERGELADVEPELVLHPDRDRYGCAADEARERFVDRIARIRHDDLVAGIDEGEDRVRSSYGPEKYARLVELKDKYDPENLFQHNQNIKPSKQAGVAA